MRQGDSRAATASSGGVAGYTRVSTVVTRLITECCTEAVGVTRFSPTKFGSRDDRPRVRVVLMPTNPEYIERHRHLNAALDRAQTAERLPLRSSDQQVT